MDEQLSKVLTAIRSHNRDSAALQTLNSFFREYFAISKMLENLPEHANLLATLTELVKYDFVPKGSFLLHEGDELTRFCMLLEGEAWLYMPKDRYEVQRLFSIQREANKRLASLQVRLCQEKQPLQGQSEQDEKQVQNKQIMNEIEQVQRQLAQQIATPYEAPLNSLCLEEKNSQSIINKKLCQKYYRQDACLYKLVKKMHRGEHFSENCVEKDTPSSFTLYAAQDLHLATLPRREFVSLFEPFSSELNFTQEFLGKLLLAKSSKKEIARIAYDFDSRIFKIGTFIYRQGQEARSVFLIKQGDVEISFTRTVPKSSNTQKSVTQNLLSSFQPLNSKQTTVKTIVCILGAGQFFGHEDIERVEKVSYRRHTALALGNVEVEEISKAHYFSGNGEEIKRLLKGYQKMQSKTRGKLIQKTQEVQDAQQIEEVRSQKTPAAVQVVQAQQQKNGSSWQDKSTLFRQLVQKWMNKDQILQESFKNVEPQKQSFKTITTPDFLVKRVKDKIQTLKNLGGSGKIDFHGLKSFDDLEERMRIQMFRLKNNYSSLSTENLQEQIREQGLQIGIRRESAHKSKTSKRQSTHTQQSAINRSSRVSMDCSFASSILDIINEYEGEEGTQRFDRSNSRERIKMSLQLKRGSMVHKQSILQKSHSLPKVRRGKASSAATTPKNFNIQRRATRETSLPKLTQILITHESSHFPQNVSKMSTLPAEEDKKAIMLCRSLLPNKKFDLFD